MISDKQIPLSKCIDFIVDNRGKTAPTSDSGIPLITNCIDNENLYPVFEIRYVSEDTYKNWFRAHPLFQEILYLRLKEHLVVYALFQKMLGL